MAEPHQPRPVRRATAIGACAFVLLLVVGMKVRGDDNTARPASSQKLSAPRGAEARLAAMQPLAAKGTRAAATLRVGSLLDILAAECVGDTRTQLAAFGIQGVRELRAAGIPASPTEVLGGVLGHEDGGAAHCRGEFERYIALELRERSLRSP